jgi:hypothetical protein
LHNPYVATPLSIAAYRSSTSPSDQNNESVVDWLDKLTASFNSDIKSAGGTMASKSFTFTSNLKETAPDSDSDGDAVTTVLGGDAQDDPDSDNEGSDDSGVASSAAEALPDISVPIGLIANLSLSNGKTSKKDRDDEDLVSSRYSLSVWGN